MRWRTLPAGETSGETSGEREQDVDDFDFVIIGAGGAGEAAAYERARYRVRHETTWPTRLARPGLRACSGRIGRAAVDELRRVRQSVKPAPVRHLRSCRLL
jgi:hypothetical protein